MYLRIFSATILLCVAGCGGPPEGVAPANVTDTAAAGSGTPAGDPVERIACSVGGAAMEPVCTVDRATDGEARLVTIRHPDGGFRRLRIAPDGSVAAADGAVPAEVSPRDGIVEVAIGDARYRLPLTRP